jgi:RNA polymerase sigma-70 factor (ECF subfamily)
MIEGGTSLGYRELAQRMRPFVARRVPESDLEDVLQDIFLRMQRALPGLADAERFGPWLYQLARSAIAEHHRQRARHPLVADEGEDRCAVNEHSGPSPLEVEIAEYLAPLVAALPSPYREALSLTELEGMTQQAAAERLGISLSGMKSRVQRGREKLRKVLEDCCRIALDPRGHVLECEPRLATGCRCKHG